MVEAKKGNRLFMVPAGGFGTRLHPLTMQQAKPSLPISFEGREVTRLIDIPLVCARRLGGTAIVSTHFQPESLRFVEDYAHVTRVQEEHPQTPIDTLMRHGHVLRQASEVWIVPGDADIELDQLESMAQRLVTSGANAVTLGTHHRGSHNVWPVDNEGRMTTPNHRQGESADLGVHVMQATWLAERLAQLDPNESNNIWEHVYDYRDPKGDIFIHIPDKDRHSIDLGTPRAYEAKVRALTGGQADHRGNILFPGASVKPGSSNVIALPHSYGGIRLAGAILPENTVVNDRDQVLSLAAQ